MKVLILILLLPISSIANSQSFSGRFQKAIDKGISITKLDSIYPSAVHSDSSKAVFKGREKEFYEGYVSMLNTLAGFLKENGFRWDKKTRCFNRVYFNSEGKINYFLFNFYPDQIESTKEQQFEKLIGDFIKTYQFPLKANSNFAQCSPVSYNDK